ncbi:MAG: peptide-methionine (R)-S-oxide reductase MsrB [Bdellovibrionota bacterium]
MNKENSKQVNWKEKTEEYWKSVLTPEQYKVLRESGTEKAFTGAYWDSKDNGVYRCAACGQALFASETKFESGTGWPSFYDTLNPEAIKLVEDNTFFMSRTEVRCASCDSHLGHMFDDGPSDKTGKRYCINSTALEIDKN